MLRRFVAILSAVILACGLVPSSALASESAEEGSSVQLEPGTYVEHEALAYVVADGSSDGIAAFWQGGSVLDDAKTLMEVDAQTVKDAVDESDGAQSGESAAVSSRSLSTLSESDEGRLVLVRDESKTTEQLIEELMADGNVVFAEPNYTVDAMDDGQDGAADQGDETEGQGGFVDVPSSVDEGAGGLDGGTSSQGGASSEGGAQQNTGTNDSTASAVGSDAESAANEGADSSAAADSAAFGEDSEAPAKDLSAFQWAYDNDGSLSGVSADEAVDIGYQTWEDAAASSDWSGAASATGLADMVVAVIDSGVDASNPDLASVMWSDGDDPALSDLGGDEHGFSTVEGLSSAEGVSNYHGTHVAGSIAAAWDGQGISGVAPNAQIMSVRHNNTTSSILQCMAYVTAAAERGVNVRVANCSWGMGANASLALNAAFFKMGEAGVVSVVGSGNSTTDTDLALNTVTMLRDNPYVVVVDSVDANGAMSAFSNWGDATTDVMAPGSSILSTWSTSSQNYLGEADGNATLYESFDGETSAATGVKSSSGEQIAGGSQALSFYDAQGGALGGTEAEQRFDGDAAYELPYDAEAAVASGSPFTDAVSSEIDLSGLAEKPRYLSIRYKGVLNDESLTGIASVGVSVQVSYIEEGELKTGYYGLAAQGSFGSGGDMWSGFYVDLSQIPEGYEITWDSFRIQIRYATAEFSSVGGVQNMSNIQDGTVLIDSIGLGSDLVPYQYLHGTSMATPAVAGAACVIAGEHTDDSAAQLAARVKGAAQQQDRYAEYCSTSGYATVDGADNPAPVPVSAALSEDGSTIAVRGYFAPDGTTVSVGGVDCPVVSRESVAGEGDLVELTVKAPDGFSGGEQEVALTCNGKTGRMIAEFASAGSSEQGTLYEQTNLPVPEQMQMWDSWQLVGFAGDIYALPQANETNPDMSYTEMLRYSPDTGQWEAIALPLDEFAAAGAGNVASVSGTTYRGELVMQVTSFDRMEDEAVYVTATYWAYSAQGTWRQIPVSLPSGGDLGFSTLASDGDNLYAFGGLGSYSQVIAPTLPYLDTNVILRIDVDGGTASNAGTMTSIRQNPRVAYRDGAFLVAGGQAEQFQLAGVMGAERVTPLEEPYEIPGTGVTYPAGWLMSQTVDLSSLVDETGQLAYAVAAVEAGFMLVGPQNKEGTADTYTLANEAGAVPQAFNRRASQSSLLLPAATAYDGMLYVLAASSSDSERVFSATPVPTTAQPGDYVAPGPDPSGEGGDPEDDGGSTLSGLASTGDPLAILPFAAVAVGAAGAMGACALHSRRKREGVARLR